MKRITTTWGHGRADLRNIVQRAHYQVRKKNEEKRKRKKEKGKSTCRVSHLFFKRAQSIAP